MSAVLKASEFGVDLVTRLDGRVFRNEVESLVCRNGSVIVDLDGVRFISYSFADEAFAVLAQKNGVDSFKKRISFRNASDDARETILSSLINRTTVCWYSGCER